MTTEVLMKVFESYQQSKEYKGFEVNDEKLNAYLNPYLTAVQLDDIHDILHESIAKTQEKCFIDGLKLALKVISDCLNDKI